MPMAARFYLTQRAPSSSEEGRRAAGGSAGDEGWGEEYWREADEWGCWIAPETGFEEYWERERVEE